MIHLQRKYLLLIAYKLEKFKQLKPDLYRFRCPICGDSQKNKLKCRGFIYRKDEDLVFKCHNCLLSIHFLYFLEKIDEPLYNQYRLEKIANRVVVEQTVQPVEAIPSIPVFREHIDLPTIASLDDDHEAKQFILKRKIPETFHSFLFYAEDFKAFTDKLVPNHDKKLYVEPRIIIPFYDENKRLTCFQGRSLEKQPKLKYITIKQYLEGSKIFGAERIDKTKKIYVFEGAIDSMFIPNSIATNDASLTQAAKYYAKNDLTLVFDNEYGNKDIKLQITKAINQNFNVCLFPKNMVGKDINEFILNGYNVAELQQIIDDNTFNGLRASLEFNQLKR